MSQPILITGAAGGQQGSTGRLVTGLLLKQGIPVRAFVHKLDARSDELRQRGAEILEGDLLNPASVRAAMRNVKRAFFTYPVADGLLEATAIFAATARDAGLELVVNNSQFQNAPGESCISRPPARSIVPESATSAGRSYLRLGADWGRSHPGAPLL